MSSSIHSLDVAYRNYDSTPKEPQGPSKQIIQTDPASVELQGPEAALSGALGPPHLPGNFMGNKEGKLGPEP